MIQLQSYQKSFNHFFLHQDWFALTITFIVGMAVAVILSIMVGDGPSYYKLKSAAPKEAPAAQVQVMEQAR